ncbi:MAG: ATP-binding protein [Chitinophagales bacterium]
MNTINNIEDAQNFIYNYNLYKSKAENQTELYETLKKCEHFAIECADNILLAKTRIYLTNHYILINDLENALHLGLENKEFTEHEGLEEENLQSYSGLINVYTSLGDYANVGELIYKYKEKLLNYNDYNRLCSLYIIEAIQYHNLKDYSNCLLSNNKAVEYAILSKNPNLIIYAYSNLGYQFINQDELVSKNALENALNIIKHNRKKIPIYSIAIVEVNSARLYLKVKDYKLANKLIRSAIKKLQYLNNVNELHHAKMVLCELLIEQNKFKQAVKILYETESNSLKHNNKITLLACYKNYIHLFEKKNKYKFALEYYKKIQLLNEELYNEESNKKIQNLQILNEVNTIKRQRDHAEAIANIKHDFLANMSHEIRTPINSILGICYLMQQNSLNEKQSNYVNRLKLSGENLLNLINDILDISKIEAGKMELVPVRFNIKTLVENIYQQFIDKADEKKLQLILKTDNKLNVTIEGDATRLTQIILNLVSNALKFTKEGTVTLDFSILKLSKDKCNLHFVITDTGIGISKDKVENIFQPYEQASADIKTQFGGTGLGLSITRKIIELMEGTIEVNSVINQGTSFIVNIPFYNTDKQPIEKVSKISNTDFLNNKFILIADDNIENRLVMKEILLTFNHTVEIDEAENGEDAIKKAINKNYDVILMDLDMPIKNGIDATIEILKINQSINLKIIAHTASLLTMSKNELLAIGFADLLQKPFKPNVLHGILQNILHKKA